MTGNKRLAEIASRSFVLAALFWVITGIGVVRIVSTYNVFTHTYDEPAHIACGMELLDRKTYTYELNHPPLPRVAAALGPYLHGLRSWRRGSQYEEGNQILYGFGDYWVNLKLARLGILPFFVVACGVVWVWSKDLFGNSVALLATALFSTLPSILAHAGLATTDMAVTAWLAASLHAIVCWLERPGMLRSVWMGCSVALAFLSKLSAPVFLLPCVAAILLLRLRFKIARPRRRMGLVACAFLVFFLVVWAGYGFSLAPLWPPESRPHALADRAVGKEGLLHDLTYWLIERPVPAWELFRGLELLFEHNRGGQGGYLLGEFRTTGWWYFFPVALGLKPRSHFSSSCCSARSFSPASGPN